MSSDWWQSQFIFLVILLYSFQALCLAWPQMGRQRPFRSHAIACMQLSCGLSVSAFYQGRVAFHVYGDYWAESTHVKRISISHPFFFFFKSGFFYFSLFPNFWRFPSSLAQFSQVFPICYVKYLHIHVTTNPPSAQDHSGNPFKLVTYLPQPSSVISSAFLFQVALLTLLFSLNF